MEPPFPSRWLQPFNSNAAERPSGTPRGYVEHFRQKRWPDGELVRAFLQGRTVTPPSMQKTSVGQVDSRRLKHVAKKLCKESQFQSCSVLPTWNTSISFQKINIILRWDHNVSTNVNWHAKIWSIAHAFVRYANQSRNLNHPCKLA